MEGARHLPSSSHFGGTTATRKQCVGLPRLFGTRLPLGCFEKHSGRVADSEFEAPTHDRAKVLGDTFEGTSLNNENNNILLPPSCTLQQRRNNPRMGPRLVYNYRMQK